VLLSVVAGVLIALTVLAAIRLIMRMSQAQELAVNSSITEESAAPRGAWISVGVLAALSLVASYFAWGRGLPGPSEPPRRPPVAEAPKAPSPGPAIRPPRAEGGGLQRWLDWLRPHPRPPAPPKRGGADVASPEAPVPEDAPPNVVPETPPSDGKPSGIAAPEVTPAPPIVPAIGPAITDPVWMRQPGPNDTARFQPDGAKGRTGAAVIECQVNRMGRLRNCRVLVENPRGQGFGSAALRVAFLYRMRETSRSGQPTEGRTVRVPVAFVPTS
jgi:TonB family protein